MVIRRNYYSLKSFGSIDDIANMDSFLGLGHYFPDTLASIFLASLLWIFVE
jgi:hypothetical protein